MHKAHRSERCAEHSGGQRSRQGVGQVLETSRKSNPSQKSFKKGRRTEDPFMSHPSSTSTMSNSPGLLNSSQHSMRETLGGNVKDDSGCRAVSTEQGASSSHMAAKILAHVGSTPKYFDCQGENAQVWLRLPPADRTPWDSIEEPVDLIERNLFG